MSECPKQNSRSFITCVKCGACAPGLPATLQTHLEGNNTSFDYIEDVVLGIMNTEQGVSA